MEPSNLPIILLGFLLGMKHALDVDHLAAVTTMLPNQRSRWQVARIGAWWGIGHAAILMAVGGAIIAFDLTFPPTVSLVLEFGVGMMLIVLGLRLLIRVRRGWTVHLHPHSHGERLHIHPHVHGGNPRQPSATSPAVAPGTASAEASSTASSTMLPTASATVPGHHRTPPAASRDSKAPLFVGMIHGLAGSAGLTLILLPMLPSRLMGLIYLALFGAGSVLGMTLATYLVSIPLGRLAPGGRAALTVSVTAGCLSLISGAVLMLTTGGVLLPR